MKKSILKASVFTLMVISFALGSCEAIKDCCGKKSCSTDSTSTTCSKCGKTSCEQSCSSNPSTNK